jgi:hypothetical protein
VPSLRLFASLLLFAASLAVAEPKTKAFAVGALRRDGAIIPFATFDGKRWDTNWPSPMGELTIPITLGAIPSRWWGPTSALAAWDAWTGGAAPQPVTVTQPAWVPVHCQRQIVLETNYKSSKQPPPVTEQPYPKDGFAVSPPQAVESIDLLAATSIEAQELVGAVRDAFNAGERRMEEGYGHPIARRAREGVVPTIEAVYAYGDQTRFYYVESTRPYRRLGQSPDQCEAIGFGTGWFVRENSRLRSIATDVDLLRCDRVGANYMYPFGVIRADGKIFWLAQFAGWNREWFVVLELKPKTVESRASAFGGSC